MKNKSKLQNPNVIYQRVRGENTWHVFRTYKNEYDARKAFREFNHDNPTIEYRRGMK